MQPLSAPELLRVWEQGQGKPPYQKAMLILVGACPDESLEALERLSVGSRDSLLLILREWTFGPELNSITVCPACNERLEFSLKVADMRSLDLEKSPLIHHLDVNVYSIEFRLPNTGDLVEAQRCADLEGMQRVIAERCICSAWRQGEQIEPKSLPPEVFDVMALQMAEAGAQADSRLSLSCPTCNHRWQALFDIVTYFWSEMEFWAVRVLGEVHFLASAYGWHEADILAMSPLRRRIYMEMVR